MTTDNRTTKIHIGNLTAKSGIVYDFTEITGHLDARSTDTNNFPKLTTVGGDACFRGWAGSAPKLTTVGGDAYFRDWAGSAPKLTTVGGYAYFVGWAGSAPKLTTVGGCAYFRGWAGSAPKLTTVGGYAYFRGWTGFREGIKTGDINAFAEAVKKEGLCYVDGILAKVINKRGPVSRVVIVGQAKQSYIVERDGKFAHGETLSEARADLLLKLGNRDTSAYKAWKPETKVKLEEIIAAYRAITGACKKGCSHFLSSKNYPPKVTVGFIIEETKGAYEHETFRNFFNK